YAVGGITAGNKAAILNVLLLECLAANHPSIDESIKVNFRQLVDSSASRLLLSEFGAMSNCDARQSEIKLNAWDELLLQNLIKPLYAVHRQPNIEGQSLSRPILVFDLLKSTSKLDHRFHV